MAPFKADWTNADTSQDQHPQAHNDLAARLNALSNVDNTLDASKPVSTAQAAAIALKVSKSGDTMTGLLILPAGSAGIGGLQIGTDTTLYRSAADILRTDDSLWVIRNTATYIHRVSNVNPSGVGSWIEMLGTGNVGLAIGVQSDAQIGRILVLADGRITWGNGTAVADTNLYRSAADTLKTDDSLVVAGNLTVSGSGGGWTYRGAYNGASAYVAGDLVLYQGSTYVANQAVAAGTPTELFAPSNATERTFETSIGAWALNQGTIALSRDTAQFHSGVASLKVTNTGGSAAAASVYNPTYKPSFTAGHIYNAKCWVRTSSTQDVRLQVLTNNNFNGSLVSVPANTWTLLTLAFTASTTATDFVMPYVQSLPAGDSFWIDDLTVYDEASLGALDTTKFNKIAGGLPSYTTAGRPAASAVAVGTEIYDTTLSKPIWSNGSAWKDATGTTV